MSPLQIHARGIAPRMIKDGAPALTLGRSTQNDLVIPDHSLSRHHAKVWAERGRAFIEDLGSRNWTLVNGERIIGPQSVTPSDEVQVGNVRIFIEEVSSSQVLIDRTTQVDFPMPTMIIQAEKLRGGFPLKTGDDRLTQALGFIQEITLQLIREGSTQQLLEHLVERLHAYLDSGRAVALLRDAAGELKPAVVRTRRGGTESIRLPHTLVESVLERREAILLNDPEAQSSLASKSLMQIGITTAIITPTRGPPPPPTLPPGRNNATK